MGEGMMIAGWFFLIWVIIIALTWEFINPIITFILAIISSIVFHYYMAYKWNDYNWMCDIGKRRPVKKDKPTLTTHVIKCGKKEME